MNLIKQSSRNIVVNIVSKIFMLLLPFAVRSVMIYTLGNIYLGLDSLFSSLLSMLSLSELGFNSAIVFAMYKPVAQGDDTKVRALLSFYKKVYYIVGSVILGLGLLLAPHIKFFIAADTIYPQEVNLYFVYLVLLVNTSLSYFLFAYKNVLLIATMRNDLDGLLNLLRSVLCYGIQMLALVLLRSYYLYILVLPLITIANNLIRKHIIDRRYPQYRGQEVLRQEDQKDLLSHVRALVGNKIGAVVFASVDTIVISAFLGLSVLGKYSNYYAIFAAVYALESIIFSTLQSTIGNVLVTKSREQCYRLFNILFTINAPLTGFCTCCFLVLYQPFMALWVGESNLLPFEVPLLLSIFFFAKGTRRILFMFKEAAGMWRETFWLPYLSVLLNLVSNIVLVQVFGLSGVILSSIFALVLVEIPWETTAFFKQFFRQKTFPYIKRVLITTCAGFVASTASFWIMQIFSDAVPNKFLQLVLGVFTCLLVCSFIYFPILWFSPDIKLVKQYLHLEAKRK